jgi:prevent-host-death family protein
MNTLTVVDAKKHFSKVLQRAGEGEEFVITSHGRPIARIVGPPTVSTREERQAAVERILEFRKKHRLSEGETLKELVNEGRP